MSCKYNSNFDVPERNINWNKHDTIMIKPKNSNRSTMPTQQFVQDQDKSDSINTRKINHTESTKQEKVAQNTRTTHQRFYSQVIDS